MKMPSKQLSNPFSTGGGGAHFEAHVQAIFVILMLAGGLAPTMPSWPIRQIRLQNKIHGFHTDDLIVVLEDQNSNREAKLVAQIRHTVSFTKSDSRFRDLIQAAWRDFNDEEHFDRQIDNVALITGPLSAKDTQDIPWLLNHARHTTDSHEFFLKVNHTNFSSDSKRRKLKVFQNALNLSEEDLHSFLRRFHLLMYDLGSDAGTILSLLNSLILQFENVNPEWAWGRVVDIVQSWNQDAGTISFEDIPVDLRDCFTRKASAVMTPKFSGGDTVQAELGRFQAPQGQTLVAANLLGAWDDNAEADLEIVNKLMTRDRS